MKAGCFGMSVSQGFSRDRRIAETIEKCGMLSTAQVAVLLFGDMKTGHRKAQERLQKLYRRKVVSRLRLSPNEPYIYYQGRQMAHVEHRVALNWALIWLLRTMKSWEKGAGWEYEVSFGYLRPDMVFATENSFTGQVQVTFVELDRSNNRWDKTAKYNRLYDSEGYLGEWWAEKAKAFPRILVVTSSAMRERVIAESVATENKHNLRFDIMRLQTMQKEVWPWARG